MMTRNIAVSRLVLLVLIAVGMTGCDEATMSALPDSAKAILDAKGLQSGDAVMDQVQQRDQLRDQFQDGSCELGPNSGAGTAQGPNGPNGSNGSGDQLRLRDGSCGL